MKRLLQITLLVSALAAHAEDPVEFEVTDIRVEGLHRISEGAVFNSLPVNIGDRIGTQRIREALRALNDTGFFRDVELRRDVSTLVVVVQERPTIRTFDVKGNKTIKTEDMSKSLRNVGLASGKVLNRYMLEDVRQYLIDQYFARGNYDVRVDVEVEEQSPYGERLSLKTFTSTSTKARSRAFVRSTWLAMSVSPTRNCSRAWDSRHTTCCLSIAVTIATLASCCPVTSRSSALTTWIAVTRTSKSPLRRWRSRQRRTTFSSQ